MKLTRFPDAKQDQVEQLIEYAQLLGLSGRDLVAIGGKIDREQAKSRKESNMELIRGFECLPVGKDDKYDLDRRFKLKTATGTYNFDTGGWSDWTITSLKTKNKVSRSVDPYLYDLPSTDWRTKLRYAILLDIALGKFQLNF
jgi:hypothetical protein